MRPGVCECLVGDTRLPGAVGAALAATGVTASRPTSICMPDAAYGPALAVAHRTVSAARPTAAGDSDRSPAAQTPR